MNHARALIFDFGNVVAHFDYARAGERFGRPLGMTGEAFMEHARANGLAGQLQVFESGGMTSEEFHRRMVELTGIGPGFDEFAAAWADIFWGNEPVHRLIAGLKRSGHTLVLGSNTNELHARHFLGQFAGVLGDFDALVLSYQVGAVKPDASFYLACAAAAGRVPGDCIFIDDMPENVEGARRAGMIGVRYAGTEGLIVELRSLGIDAAAPGLYD